ncbi:MAG: DUF1549 domain-containing protein [Planctomycetaceae bacterium]
MLALCGGVFAGERLPAEDLLSPDRPIHEAIDHYIESAAKARGVEPASLLDDAGLLRRTTLDLAGRIPASREVREYVASADADKRTRAVEALLASPDYAFHHRNWLDGFLLADKKTDAEWRDWLLAAARENRPWDAMFRAMMLGNADDPDPQQTPALAFLKARANSVDDMANDTSRLFFGVSINCAQCHDHPLVEDWKQDHYFGFQSFFNRTYLTKSDHLAEKSDGEVKFKTVLGEEKEAAFLFLTGATVDEPDIDKSDEQRKAEREEVRRQMKEKDLPPPKPPEFSPRAEFVRLALENSDPNYFARSIVNRLWVRFFGRGLVNPPDQMHSANEASHPQLLAWLERDLVTHGYDLKRLIRGIVLSRTYARSSRWDRPGDPPYVSTFAIAVPRPLSPRQYSLSLLIASHNPESLPGLDKPDDWEKRRHDLENAANGLAGEIERPGENFQVSVDEALFFSNNDRIESEHLRDSNDRLVGRLKQIEDRRQMIATAFEAILSRPPAEDEFAAVEAYLAEREDRRVEAIQQVVWALLTSPEVRFNH